MKSTVTLSAAALLALAGCSGESEPAAQENAEAAPAAIPADSPAAKLTPAYLRGEWCYLRYEAGGEESVENVTYDFAADGSLKYQNTPGAPVEQPGSFEIDGGVLVIKPALAFLKFSPVSIDDDAMILEAMGAQATWARGACAE